MIVKVVKGNKERSYPCTHYQVTTVTEDMVAAKAGLDVPGITLELCPHGPILHLPEDGDVYYVMNEIDGKTIEHQEGNLGLASLTPHRKEARHVVHHDRPFGDRQ